MIYAGHISCSTGVNTRLLYTILHNYLWESEERKVHGDRSNQLSVGRCKTESRIIFMVFTEDLKTSRGFDVLSHTTR